MTHMEETIRADQVIVVKQANLLGALVFLYPYVVVALAGLLTLGWWWLLASIIPVVLF
jgi:hypothetical protein